MEESSAQAAPSFNTITQDGLMEGIIEDASQDVTQTTSAAADNTQVDLRKWLPPKTQLSIFDHWPVPCVPTRRLPGMAFLSTKAAEEAKHGARSDELFPGDELELQFVYARMLYEDGDVRIRFPEYFKDAASLKENPIAKTVGKDCPFFFELGEVLCGIIPESDWPVPDLLKILISTRNQRFMYLLLKKTNAEVSFLKGMTYKERKMYSRFNFPEGFSNKGNKGVYKLSSFLDTQNYFLS